ncbi:MAG: NADH:ubiquinone reductase (Na(+)-transporting) subunit C [Bacteroidales bacterium]|nr:NADH:ubiquinone reductase (Na(+)-transporting) subunit C [Bacteroidales bacterium]
MNTNSNTYTIIYTTFVVVVVAAVLALVSQVLKPRQEANEKAGTISQILTAAQFEFDASSNEAILDFYKANIGEAAIVNAQGETVKTLDSQNAEIVTTAGLKVQNYKFADGSYEIPVYKFNNGTSVVPVYGAGLWGPVWGYIAVAGDLRTIVGAYFDHAGETPGLGGKIKDDPAFRAQFVGKTIDYTAETPFQISKGGSAAANGVDAITGATMTTKGVDAAVNAWLSAYRNALVPAAEEIVDSTAAPVSETIE